MRVMAPLTSSWAAMKSSSSWLRTSTRALPMPTTSMASGVRVGSVTGDHAIAASAGGSRFGRIGPGSLPPVAILDQVDDNPYRLPRTVVPRRYDLRLVPDLPSASFTGDVDIAVTVVSSTNEVVLNAIELEVDEAWVTTADGRQPGAAVTLAPEGARRGERGGGEE